MAISRSRLAISTMSLGRAWHHDLVHKLEMAAIHGFEGIELFYEDLEYYAKDHFGGTDRTDLLHAAEDIKDACSRLHLEIICLQPLMHFEGRRDPRARKECFERGRLFFQIANILDTPIVAVPSSFLDRSEITGEREVIVRDLQELADIAANYGIRLVFEALSWGTYVDHWEQSWAVVQAVDRDNFGICLDTFNIAGRIYADPASPTGKTANADAAVEASLRTMVRSVDVKKIFYIQVVDAERLSSPLDRNHEFYDASQPCRMSWSRNCRLFYGEQDRGAYLPIQRIMEAIVHGLGFEGWISMELFNRSMSDADPAVPRQHAARGAMAWKKLQSDLHWDTATVVSEVPVLCKPGKGMVPRASL